MLQELDGAMELLDRAMEQSNENFPNLMRKEPQHNFLDSGLMKDFVVSTPKSKIVDSANKTVSNILLSAPYEQQPTHPSLNTKAKNVISCPLCTNSVNDIVILVITFGFAIAYAVSVTLFVLPLSHI